MSLLILKNAEQDVIRPGDLLVEMGEKAFVTTGTSVEVTTELTEILYAFLTPSNTVTSNLNDVLITDKTISTSAVTVARGTAGVSALKFSYIFVGRKSA